jgi:hypothetical protein
MNISSRTSSNVPSHAPEAGLAVLIFISLLAIMVILVTAELRCVFQLHREVQFLEQQQIKRLNAPLPPTVTTNAVTNPTAL